MKYAFTKTARLEIREVIPFYARERRSLGVDFIEELHRSLILLLDNPRLGQRVSETLRQMRLRKFPYVLIYAIDDENDLIQISVVCHQRRQPGYWRNRVEESKPAYAIWPLAA